MSGGLNDWLKNFDNGDSQNKKEHIQEPVQNNQKLDHSKTPGQSQMKQAPIMKKNEETTQYSKDFKVSKIPKPLSIKTLGGAKTLGQKQQDSLKQNQVENVGLEKQNSQNLKIQLEISAKLEHGKVQPSQEDIRQKQMEEQAKQARLIQQQEYEKQKKMIMQKEQEDLQRLKKEEEINQKKLIQSKKQLKSQDPSLLGQVKVDLDKPQDPRSPELIDKLFIESETNIDFKGKWIEIYEKGLRSTKLNNMTRKLKSGRFRVMSGDKVEILPDMKTHHLTTKELLNKNWLE